MACLLVVDDNQSVARALAEILISAGHRVFLAYDSAQALEVLQNYTPDLALVDIGLPSGQDAGFELLQHIKARRPIIPVIMITGAASMPRVVAALRGGAQDFLEKPFSIDEVIKCIETILLNHKRFLF